MVRPKKVVTIKDVARMAGVSVSTVSRVLNNKGDVAPETEAKVRQAIEELGYISSLAARSMRNHRTGLLGLILPDVGHPFAIEILKGVNRAIAESPYDLIVYTTGSVQKLGAVEHEQRYVALLNNSIAEGSVIVAPASPAFHTKAPVVAVDPHVAYPSYPAIHATNYEGALEATRYLISLGHRRIGFICGRPELTSANRRLKGYMDALKEAGIPVNPVWIVPGDYTTETGYRCALKLLNQPDPPTAIFAANDQSALGVLRAAEELGLKVPDDLSVVGFDNIPEAEHLGLTTVDQFISEMGYIAMRMLMRIVEGEKLEHQTYQMPTKLIIRRSCAPPKT